MQVGVFLILMLINKWADMGDILALIDFEGNKMREGFNDEIDNWLYLVRVIGKEVRKVYIFFKVQTQSKVIELVHKQKEFCKNHMMNVATKMTEPEHTKRIGFLTGVHLKVALVNWYQ